MAPHIRRRQVLLFLLVCGLHGVLGWYLLATSRVMTFNTQSGGFQLLVIAPAPISVPVIKPQSGPPSATTQPPRHRVANPREDTDSKTHNNAITSAIDWNAELARAGRAASGIDPQKPIKEFDFPKRPPTTADYPQFDWDYARTHRVESIPQGGVLIHLNDNCVLVLSPLPFAFCSPFKHEANGELFKHMRDPDKPGAAPIP